MSRLTAAQTDRACGVLVGAACGDTLGAGYEFGVAPLPPLGERPAMIGGGLGGFAPGERTDDTAQTFAVASVVVEAAVAVSSLTHPDPRAGQACALWCLAIREAVLHGRFGDPRAGLRYLAENSRAFWRERFEEAERRDPTSFRPNGYVVTALQAAWSAITHTPEAAHAPREGQFACNHLVDALETAVRIGDDTDTVASVAGALLGARWGASAFPAEWRRVVHGWPGVTSGDLVDLALLTVNGGRPDGAGWPGCASIDYAGWAGHDSFAVHPQDPQVYLSGASTLSAVPHDVTAVVTLCRLGRDQVPVHLQLVRMRSTAKPCS